MGDTFLTRLFLFSQFLIWVVTDELEISCTVPICTIGAIWWGQIWFILGSNALLSAVEEDEQAEN